MRLSKWYGDCVTADGQAFIAYWARLRLGPLRLPYAATIRTVVGHATAQRVTVRAGSAPVMVDGAVRWSCTRLAFDATWTSVVRPVEHRLLDAPDGSITWRCIAARSPVDVAQPGGPALRGWGYVEQLDTTLPPCRLPMHALRWGRFVSPDAALAWIVWEGTATRHWVFRDGMALPDARISGTSVTLPEGETLTYQDATVIREGRLGRTALPAIPGVRFLAPRRCADALETKWLARGVLRGGRARSEGWVIHEVVRWA